MRYMGSKKRIAKYILPIILKDRKPNQWYVEPFCGGCNTLGLVEGNTIGADVHDALIAFLKAAQAGWVPDIYVNEDSYKRIQASGSLLHKGYAGFLFSFGAKFNGTYRRHNDLRVSKKYEKGKEPQGVTLKSNYAVMDYNNKINKTVTEKLGNAIKHVKLFHASYDTLKIPPASIIYCDPPYRGTTGYGNTFNHNLFYDWCRLQKAKGHTVFVSEYAMPKDFKCVWEGIINQSIGHKQKDARTIEKLFTL